MERIRIAPRTEWQTRVEQLGLLYHSMAAPYWCESAYYSFARDEVDALERATNELHARCIDAAQFIIDAKRYHQLGIPSIAIPLIEESWREDAPSLYGRFDLSYDGTNQPKLLEYNADTPTSLLEAGVIQWFWHQETGTGSDQFNMIHERLVLTWEEIAESLSDDAPLLFANIEDLEDEATITYLRDTAEQAGIGTQSILMDEIGWNEAEGCFVDLDERPILQLFKLYPWEWLVHEGFSSQLVQSYQRTRWIEPPWKMLLSNKGLLAILWELFPGHPNLLECYFEDGRLRTFAKKPLLSREGANITLVADNVIFESEGDYGEEGFVYQALAPLPVFDACRPVIGSWIIGGLAAGIGIRESDGPITNNLSRFVPHVIG